MKKILSLVAMLVAGMSSVWADDVTVSWAMGADTSSDNVAVLSPEGAGTAAYSVGTGLTENGTSKFDGATYTKFDQNTGSEKGNNGKHDQNVELGKYVDFTFTPVGGSFTPAKVSFNIVKNGTGDPSCDVDVIDGEGKTITVASNKEIIRNNAAAGTSTAHSYDVSGAASSEGTVTLRIVIGKLASGKSVGIANVVIEGTMISADAPVLGATKEVNLKVSPLTPGLTATATISLAGKNLADGTYNAPVPTDEAITIAPATFTVAGGEVSQEFTVTYKPVSSVTEGVTKVFFEVGELSASTTINYTARLEAYEQTIVKAAKTWDWTTLTETIQLNEESVPSRYSDFVFKELEDQVKFGSFDAQSIVISNTEYPVRNKCFQNGTIKFKTNVPGTIAVDFSDTGSSGEGHNRYLNVQGENTEFYANREEIGADQVNATGIYVNPGVVAITSCKEDGSSTAIRIYKVTFTPGELQGTTYSIVGELTGGWPTDENVTDVPMKQSADNENIYTLTINGFQAEAKEYAYKLRANFSWNDTYQLPASGDAHYTFTEAGEYNLTFTADVANHTLNLVAEKVKEQPEVYSIVGELTGGWHDGDADDVEMTKLESGLYQYVVEEFEVADLPHVGEGDAACHKYQYKLRANHKWGVFELPASGNAEWAAYETGTYKLTFTANVTGEAINGVEAYTLNLTAEKQEKVDPVELAALNPAPGLVEALPTEFVLTYGGKKFTAAEDAEYTLTQGETSYPLYVMQEDEDGNPLTDKAILAFDGKAITTPGEWLVNIPAGAIAVEGTTIEQPQSFKYTVKNPEDFTANPAPGEVESLSTITVTANNYLVEMDESSLLVYLFNEETEEEVQPTTVDVIGGGKIIYIEFPEVTKAGTWQLNVEDGFKNMTTGEYVPLQTFTYTITGSSVEVIADLAALKAYDGEGGNVKVQLTNAIVTGSFVAYDEYFDDYSYYAVVEDASAAYLFGNTGIEPLLKKGDVLNGQLPLTLAESWGMIEVLVEDAEAAIAALTITQGEVKVTEITEDNVLEYAEDADWRYVKFTDVVISVEEDEYYGEEVYKAYIPVMGDSYDLEDLFGAMETMPANGDTVTIEGYIGSLYGTAFLQPVTITKNEAEPAVSYYLVGNFNEWTAGEEFLLTKNEAADAEEYYITLDLVTANTSLKVVSSTNVWYPEGGGETNFTINDPGNYTIYFRPNADGGDSWHHGVIYAAYNGVVGINALAIDTKNAAVFNLQGVRVQNVQSGLYIVNGKKVFVKANR